MMATDGIPAVTDYLPPEMLPEYVTERLDKFCGERKTGSLQLDIKDGRVMGWQIIETGWVRTNG